MEAESEFESRSRQKERAVAIKVEPVVNKGDKVNDPRRHVLERNVLIALRNKPNIQLIYASGRTNKDYSYTIMQILRKNLTDLRKKRSEKRFTHSAVFRVAEQISTALQYLQEATFIHPDVKPTNCCLGAVPDVKHVYLIDLECVVGFELITANDDRCGKKHRLRARYDRDHAVEATLGKEYSTGKLHKKENTSAEEVCAQMPPLFVECYNYISQLKSTEFLEHVRMHKWLRDCRPANAETDDTFDWEAEHLI